MSHRHFSAQSHACHLNCYVSKVSLLITKTTKQFHIIKALQIPRQALKHQLKIISAIFSKTNNVSL